MLSEISSLIGKVYKTEKKLSDAVLAVKNEPDLQSAADAYHDTVFALMQELRGYCDAIELLMPKSLWPFPTYSDLLLYI